MLVRSRSNYFAHDGQRALTEARIVNIPVERSEDLQSVKVVSSNEHDVTCDV